LKPLHKKLKVAFSLTVEIARHSFASVLHYEKGYAAILVGDGMGHSDIQTTQHYFSGANMQERKKMNFDLLPIPVKKSKK